MLNCLKIGKAVIACPAQPEDYLFAVQPGGGARSKPPQQSSARTPLLPESGAALAELTGIPAPRDPRRRSGAHQADSQRSYGQLTAIEIPHGNPTLTDHDAAPSAWAAFSSGGLNLLAIRRSRSGAFLLQPALCQGQGLVGA